jgi:hypothetical protein
MLNTWSWPQQERKEEKQKNRKKRQKKMPLLIEVKPLP